MSVLKQIDEYLSELLTVEHHRRLRAKVDLQVSKIWELLLLQLQGDPSIDLNRA